MVEALALTPALSPGERVDHSPVRWNVIRWAWQTSQRAIRGRMKVVSLLGERDGVKENVRQTNQHLWRWEWRGGVSAERRKTTARMAALCRDAATANKLLENHEAAIALHFIHYNFARVHQTLRVTPAMEAGISDHVWSLEEPVGLL